MARNHQSDTAESRTEFNRRQFMWGIGATSMLGLTGIGTSTTVSDDRGSERDDGITWPESQALPKLRNVKHLDVLDIRDLEYSHLFLTTLQGIVNRRRPRLYILTDFEEGPFAWLDTFDVGYTIHDTKEDIDSTIENYVEEVDMIVAYDPDVHASVNVATTIAGVESGVVTDYEHGMVLTNKCNHLSLQDLRGRFNNAQEAYRWLFDEYWSKTSNRHIVGLPGGNDVPVVDIPSERQDYYDVLLEEDEQLRDSSNRDVYEVDLSPYLDDGEIYLRFDDAFEDDGWGAGVYSIRIETGAGNIIADFKPTTVDEDKYLYDSDGSKEREDWQFRFADMESYFIYEFEKPDDATELTAYIDMENQFAVAATNTAPPDPSEKVFEAFSIHRDYAVATRAFTIWPSGNIQNLFDTILGNIETNSPYLGWFGGDFEGEVSGVEKCSQNSVYVSPTDFFENMTVFSGFNANVGCRCKEMKVDTPDLENKVYVTLTYTEGDNLQYNQHRMRYLWDDDARGEIPLNWSTSPQLADAAPTIISHYQQTATENDHLTCGPSGLGYMYPQPWPNETLGAFTKQTARYMQRTDLNTIYMLNREEGQNVSLSEETVDQYTENIDPKGVTLNFGGNVSAETDILGEQLARAAGPLVSDADRLAGVIESETPDEWNGESPVFIAIGLLAWNMTPTDVVEGLQDLGSEYEIVTSDHFFDLIWEEHDD